MSFSYATPQWNRNPFPERTMKRAKPFCLQHNECQTPSSLESLTDCSNNWKFTLHQLVKIYCSTWLMFDRPHIYYSPRWSSSCRASKIMDSPKSRALHIRNSDMFMCKWNGNFHKGLGGRPSTSPHRGRLIHYCSPILPTESQRSQPTLFVDLPDRPQQPMQLNGFCSGPECDFTLEPQIHQSRKVLKRRWGSWEGSASRYELSYGTQRVLKDCLNLRNLQAIPS